MMDILMSETCWAHKKWNKFGLLFFNYHNEARFNEHKIRYIIFTEYMFKENKKHR